jgi:sterol desaturase/sphingolipid hydroxylase (fatty acid hydroxylase superfamily)
MEKTTTLGGLLIAFGVLFVIFRGLELTRPKTARTPPVRKGLLTDLSYWLLNPLVADRLIRGIALIALAVFALIVYGRIDEADVRGGFGPISRLPLWVQAGLMLIVADFLGYWTHRLFHGRRLWRFHAVHHAPRTLDWLSAVRVHPVNELAGRLAMMVPLLCLGFVPTTLLWAAPVFGFFGLLLHANVEWDWGGLRKVIASPRFHRWHHSSDAEAQDKNFAGLLPIWDLMFGTYYMPEGRAPGRFGTETPVPEGLLAQLMFPFRAERSEATPAPRQATGPPAGPFSP